MMSFLCSNQAGGVIRVVSDGVVHVFRRSFLDGIWYEVIVDENDYVVIPRSDFPDTRLNAMREHFPISSCSSKPVLTSV